MKKRFLSLFFLPLALFCQDDLKIGSSYILRDMRYEFGNLREQIEMLQERIQNQELTIDALRSKILEIESIVKANDQRKSIKELAKTLKQVTLELRQEQENRKNLTEAVQVLTEALDMKMGDNSKDKEAKIYRVQPGDTLEKIAKVNKITIQALKELNGLSQDKIIVGQKLKLP